MLLNILPMIFFHGQDARAWGLAIVTIRPSLPRLGWVTLRAGQHGGLATFFLLLVCEHG